MVLLYQYLCNWAICPKLLVILVYLLHATRAQSPSQDEFIRNSAQTADTSPLFASEAEFAKHTSDLFSDRLPLQKAVGMAVQLNASPQLAAHLTSRDMGAALAGNNCNILFPLFLKTGRQEFFNLINAPEKLAKVWKVIVDGTSMAYPSVPAAYFHLDKTLYNLIPPSAFRGLDVSKFAEWIGPLLASISANALDELLSTPNMCNQLGVENVIRGFPFGNANLKRVVEKCPGAFQDTSTAGWSADTILKTLSDQKLYDYFATKENCRKQKADILNNIPPNIITGNCANELLEQKTTPIEEEKVRLLPTSFFETCEITKFHDSLIKAMSPAQLAASLWSKHLDDPSTNHMNQSQIDQTIILTVQKRYHGCSFFTSGLINRASPNTFRFLDSTCWKDMDPKLMLKLDSASLTNLPSNAWQDVASTIIVSMEFTENEEFPFSHNSIKRLIGSMGTARKPSYRGNEHTCRHLGELFKILPQEVFRSFNYLCIQNTAPSSFANLAGEKLIEFNSTVVNSLNSQQISAIAPKEFEKLSVQFWRELNKGAEQRLRSKDRRIKFPGCLGLTHEQINQLKDEPFWSEIKSSCLWLWKNEVWMNLDQDVISMIPAKFFETWPMPLSDPQYKGSYVAANVIAKLTAEQIGSLGVKIDITKSSKMHPCYEVEMNFSSIGSDSHEEVLKNFPAECFGFLHANTLMEMKEETISFLPNDILKEVKVEKFEAIPPIALQGIRPEQMDYLDPKLCKHLDERKIDVLNKSNVTDRLPSGCIYRMPETTWKMVLQNRMPIMEDGLKDIEEDKLRDLSFLATSDEAENEHSMATPIITSKQWSFLSLRFANQTNVRIHPCNAIRMEHVIVAKEKEYPLSLKAFWQGINPACFAALSFFAKLTKKELDLVSDTSFSSISDHQYNILLDVLGKEGKERLERGRDCSNYTTGYIQSAGSQFLFSMTPHCVSKWNPSIMEVITKDSASKLTPQAFSLISRDHIFRIRPEALDGLTKEHWLNLSKGSNGVSCSGFQPSQTAHIRFDLVLPSCVLNMEPKTFGDISPQQLNLLRHDTIRGDLDASLISAVLPEVMAKFTLFGILGSNWMDVEGRSLLDHPCNGVTSTQQRALVGSIRNDFEKQCLPILATIENVATTNIARVKTWLWVGFYALTVSLLLR